MKRYWKLLQKEEAKLNDEKRVWRASFRDYLTESEIVDRLLATCPNLRQGYQLYQDVLYAVKKRDHSLFEDCLSREVSYLKLMRQLCEHLKSFCHRFEMPSATVIQMDH